MYIKDYLYFVIYIYTFYRVRQSNLRYLMVKNHPAFQANMKELNYTLTHLNNLSDSFCGGGAVRGCVVCHICDGHHFQIFFIDTFKLFRK